MRVHVLQYTGGMPNDARDDMGWFDVGEKFTADDPYYSFKVVAVEGQTTWIPATWLGRNDLNDGWVPVQTYINAAHIIHVMRVRIAYSSEYQNIALTVHGGRYSISDDDAKNVIPGFTT